jgi:hypothetical protein
MHVSKRDWLILRGRLRAYASVALLPLSLGILAGRNLDAAGDGADDEESAESCAAVSES